MDIKNSSKVFLEGNELYFFIPDNDRAINMYASCNFESERDSKDMFSSLIELYFEENQCNYSHYYDKMPKWLGIDNLMFAKIIELVLADENFPCLQAWVAIMCTCEEEHLGQPPLAKVEKKALDKLIQLLNDDKGIDQKPIEVIEKP